MPLHTALPIDLFLSLLLRCSCADLLRLQQCSHAFYDLLHSDRCVDYLLRQHCRLTASQLANFSLSLNQVTPQQPVDFLFRLLPCLASVEVHSLASHTLPPLHRAVLVEAVLHSSLSTSDLSVLHEQPTSLLPWLDTPDSPLLRLQLQEIVDLAHHADKLTLHSLHLPDICLWLRPQAACWRQSWDEYWMAAMHTASHHNKERQQAEEDRDGKEAAADDDDAKSEYDERSAWMSSTLERLADKRHIGQQLDQSVLWIGHCQQSVCQPPAVFGYFLGHVQHRQHRVPATIHHNDYTLHAAYGNASRSVRRPPHHHHYHHCQHHSTQHPPLQPPRPGQPACGGGRPDRQCGRCAWRVAARVRVAGWSADEQGWCEREGA